MYLANIDGGLIPGTKYTTIGGIIYRDSTELFRYSRIGPPGSSTVAEFASLVHCVSMAAGLGIPALFVRTDATVVRNALNSLGDLVAAILGRAGSNDTASLGIFYALRAKTGEHFGNDLDSWMTWFRANKGRLKERRCYEMIPTSIRQDVVAVASMMPFTVQWIPREQNRLANRLARKARQALVRVG